MTTVPAAAHRLSGLAAAWRRRWLAGVALAAGAGGLLAGVAAARLSDLPVPDAIWLGVGLAATAFGLAGAVRPRVDGRAVARHLDRTLPALEDSATLLLHDPARLVPLARLQYARAVAALDRATPALRLPHRSFTRSLRIAAALLVAAAALAVWPSPAAPGVPRAATVPGDTRRGRQPRPPALIGTTVRVTPPRYTGRPARIIRGWELEHVEEGATVRWDVRTESDVTTVTLVTTEGDTLVGPAPAVVARHSALYTVTAAGPGGTVTSPYHRLLVVPDRPPTLAIVRPDVRTLLPPGAAPRVDVEVLAADDYGIAATGIVATVTTGRGEGVAFREARIAFARRERRAGGGLLLRTTLDLAALGMGPGDELYFHVRATDGRTPIPNEARSETHFVALVDTAAVILADFSGLGVNLLPEYFRSQRQIIIDTERLLAERAGLIERAFRDRSQNIGLDQHALRVRYGEIVGDELAEEGEAFDPAEQHEHDTEENATRLSRSVKETLRLALNEMWQAELRLRTYDPQGALPFEYRALELLKQVQQAVRVYVQRVGFEPPPIEVDRIRLTGDLAAVASRTRTTDHPAAPPFPAIRAALDALAGGAGRTATVAALEAAGRELAPLAIADPARHLDGLRDLRTLITALQAGGATPCPGCAARVEAALLAALPPPERAATRSPGAPRGPGAGAARTYFQLLERPR